MSRDARLALGLVALLVALALVGPLIAPGSPAQPGLPRDMLLVPSAAHWLGTDQYSRDVFARLAYGARISLGVATIAVTVAAVVGMLLGLAAGTTRGPIAAMLRGVIDLGLALPRVIVLLVVIVAIGKLPCPVLAVLLGLTGWPPIARLVRGEALRLRHLDFVTAARALGASSHRVVFREILPGTVPPVLVAATLGLADVILLEAGLSFLGVGVPASVPSWGSMLLDSRPYLTTAPWLLLAPCVALVVATSAATLLGEAFRRTLQPGVR